MNLKKRKMSKFKSLKCFLRMHEYEIHEEIEMYDIRNNIIGKIIINRCKNCGKIKIINISTTKNYQYGKFI